MMVVRRYTNTILLNSKSSEVRLVKTNGVTVNKAAKLQRIIFWGQDMKNSLAEDYWVGILLFGAKTCCASALRAAAPVCFSSARASTVGFVST